MELDTATEIPELTEIPDAEAQDQYVLSPAEASELVAGHPWSRFVVIGDSVAKGKGDLMDGYATATLGGRIAAALAAARDDFTYTNIARTGAKAAEIRDEQVGPALELRPDLVLLIGGGNDLLTEDDVDISAVKAVLDEIVVALMDGGATVVTFEPLDLPGAYPLPAFAELNRRVLALYAATREIAQERGTIHVDCYRQPWSADQDCFSEDLQHPTMRAQALGASMAIRMLGEHLRAGR